MKLIDLDRMPEVGEKVHYARTDKVYTIVAVDGNIAYFDEVLNPRSIREDNAKPEYNCFIARFTYWGEEPTFNSLFKLVVDDE